jgi:hypothetical protein
MADVIGVVKEVGDLSEITTRNNKTVCPSSNIAIVTSLQLLVYRHKSATFLWWIIRSSQSDSRYGESKQSNSALLLIPSLRAKAFVLAITMASGFPGSQTSLKKISAPGVSLSLLSSGSMVVSPDIPEAHALKGWYMDGGTQTPFKSHTQFGLSAPGGAVNRSEMRTINDVKDAQLGMSDKPDFFSMRATVMHIKTDNIVYPACPTPQCNKKVTETHDGWRCEKCDRSHEKPEYRSVRFALHYFINLVIRRARLQVHHFDGRR